MGRGSAICWLTSVAALLASNHSAMGQPILIPCKAIAAQDLADLIETGSAVNGVRMPGRVLGFGPFVPSARLSNAATSVCNTDVKTTDGVFDILFTTSVRNGQRWLAYLILRKR